MVDREEALRRLTLGDDRFLEHLVAARRDEHGPEHLGHLEEALVKLGALAASDGPDQAFQQVIGAALNAGMRPAQVVDAIVALAPLIGSSRVTSIAPKVAVAIGYDIETALTST